MLFRSEYNHYKSAGYYEKLNNNIIDKRFEKLIEKNFYRIKLRHTLTPLKALFEIIINRKTKLSKRISRILIP